MSKADKLKTKRERIIHNEHCKLIATLCAAGAIACIFVLAFELNERADALLHSGRAWQLWAKEFTYVIGAIVMSCILVWAAWITIDLMVDPDPDPDKPAPKSKARRASRSK